jgi:uncharacterized protein with HEPN domain
MSDPRIRLVIEQMLEATDSALSYVEGFVLADFMADKRTQQAVTLNLLILGECATKIMERHADYATAQTLIPWQSMRGMRNRIAHGYFEIDFTIVWETVIQELPPLKANLLNLLPR